MVLQKIRATKTYQRVSGVVQRYERFFMPGMLLLGTALDAVQFRVLSIESTFVIAGIYAMICALTMLLMVKQFQRDRAITRYAKLVAPLLQQFTIGALLSTSLLFYWFSGTFSVSWPLIGGIALLMLSNEFLRKAFIRPIVQVGVFYFALFSLSATLAAFLANSLHPVVFVVGGIASLLIMTMFLVAFIRAGGLFASRLRLWLTVMGVFAAMNISYFLNVIPPIPLSLRDAGMYYQLTRQGGEYVLTGEPESWLQRVTPGQTMYIVEGQPLYAYTAIAAPAALSTTMVHRWQWYDETTGDWTTMSTLQFDITGGRGEGYRGYSLKSNLREGRWRVSVETLRGQVLGRIRFAVEYRY